MRWTRRRFLGASAAIGLGAAFGELLPAYAAGSSSAAGKADVLAGERIALEIAERRIAIGPREARATVVNGTMPGPLIRLREGQDVVLDVTNRLPEDSSIHWHGLLLPPAMDGVPGVSFAGIAPGETFRYRFPVKQSGTYWYHSHSGLQEQTGVFGPLVIEPRVPEPFAYDRDYVVLLSDWTFEDPLRVLANLKKQASYYNYQQRTLGTFLDDVRRDGWSTTLSDRLMWGGMRMDPTDISDITGATYTYLMNGMPPESGWTGLFAPGERVRLRLINAGAATYFDVRIPGLKMTVVQADGQNVRPIEVDELRVAIAETYDVIVHPGTEPAYAIFAEAIDRSGFALGTLASREGLSAPAPERRARPLLAMADMGMAMDHGGSHETAHDGGNVHAAHGGAAAEHAPSGHGANYGGSMPAARQPVPHGAIDHGPGNSANPEVTLDRTAEPGLGLDASGRRVLLYSDLRSLDPGADQREPSREIELHLTGNMERYMWSFDGKKYSEAGGPIRFERGERVRLVLVNDTMMNHPIHLHGMWLELENGAGGHRPRKHTVNVKPAERLSVVITADAPGDWALHCHILYHMEMGMFRVVTVA